MINVTAPGKMILLGEYAVLDDAPALVCAVEKVAIVSMDALEGQEFRFSAPSLGLLHIPFVVTPKGHVRFDPAQEAELAPRLQLFARMFEFAYRHLQPKKRHGWSVRIVTDDFYSRTFHTKLGFGSSAAMCVALVTAMNRAFRSEWEEEALFRLALEAHHYAQGKVGSGIDVAASFFGGYLVYRRVYRDDPPGKLPEKLSACPGLYFTPVFTGKSASTAHMVQGVGRLKESHPAQYQKLMEHLKEISTRGSAHFKEGNAAAFLQDVKEFYAALQELGERSGVPIISQPHRRLAELAQEAGVAYKPSGAGGGDIGILFSDDAERLSVAEAKVRQGGFHPLALSVARQGRRILTD
jgi:phosphomevalonate kinase